MSLYGPDQHGRAHGRGHRQSFPAGRSLTASPGRGTRRSLTAGWAHVARHPGSSCAVRRWTHAGCRHAPHRPQTACRSGAGRRRSCGTGHPPGFAAGRQQLKACGYRRGVRKPSEYCGHRRSVPRGGLSLRVRYPADAQSGPPLRHRGRERRVGPDRPLVRRGPRRRYGGPYYGRRRSWGQDYGPFWRPDRRKLAYPGRNRPSRSFRLSGPS
jgi:hypothetical protein